MLQRKIKDKKAVVAVLGLGHVGYPMAALFAKKGYQSRGYDISLKRVSVIRKGKVISELASILPTDKVKRARDLSGVSNNLKVSNHEELLRNADVFVIDVPTPLKEDETPDLVFLENTCKTISKFLREETLVIVESTIYPGATEEVVKPILEKTGFNAGVDFYLSFSPQRIDPGNSRWGLEMIPKIVGGINRESREIACLLFSHIIDKVIPVSSLRAAEATKMLENVFRSVNIALVYDLSKLFAEMGIDIWETINAASSKPFAFLPHYPGPGVGGHCIPKDPFYLVYKARKMGLDVEFVGEAARINRNMPLYVVHIAEESLKTRKKLLKNSSFAVLGVTYKKDVPDIRRTPAKTVIAELRRASKNVMAFDPLSTESFGSKSGSFEETVKDKDCIILLVDHSYFREINIEDRINNLAPDSCLIDTRNFIHSSKLKKSVFYRCLGKP
jgi:UDP-N-acetyl-D-glucosamine dehydrogenase